MRDEDVVQSSGNVFADLGLKDADEKQTKVRLAVAVNQILRARKLSQVVAAHMLGIKQPKDFGSGKLQEGPKVLRCCA